MKQILIERLSLATLKRINTIFLEERAKQTDPKKNKNSTRVIEAEYFQTDGTLIQAPMHISIIQNKTGRAIGLLSVINDNAEPVQSQKALAVSEIRYRRLFESAKDGILILDADTGKIEDVNPYLTEMLGYSKEALIKKMIWEIGSFRDIVANKANFRQLQLNGYIRYENIPLQTAEGHRIEVEFVSNVYSANNKKRDSMQHPGHNGAQADGGRA